ncbi:gp58-like family protein, partial [Brochothrix thermosphacta]|uniref:gp58-like family protein n=1 Tax=Brochothrix thermosphacta TaxID=2756 RepID=UPI001C7D87BD
ASKVSNADFESNKTQTAELISSTVSLQNNENVRYVRFSGSGNSVNSSTHVLEIAVNDSNNKNIALEILPTAEKGSWKNLEYVTDGVSNENDKYADGKSSDENVSFVIDLKKIYQTLSSLKLWMYVAAGRVYYNVKLEVSTDKKTWKTVYLKDNYTPTKKGDTVILSNAEASSQISQLADNINLKVDTGDVINQINIDPKGVIISGKKISLDGDVRVLPGFKLAAETIDGGTFNGNSFIKAIDIKTNDGNLPIEIKGKSSIDDAGIIIEQKTKDITSGGIISDSR